MELIYRILLKIHSSEDDLTFSQIKKLFAEPKKEVDSAIGELERWGMIKGFWERNRAGKWERFYCVSGEGTADFIKVLLERRDAPSPKKEAVVDYDRESNVCYINFSKPPQEADFSNRVGDFIFRSRNGEPIGVTIMNFSKYEKLIKALVEMEVGKDGV